MHENANKLIPELAKWNNGEGISLLAWIDGIGRFDHAIGYGIIFWPDFTIYEDCLFMFPPNPKDYQEWMVEMHGNKSDVEAMINHWHIIDIFHNAAFKPDKAVIVYIGTLLRDMWSCKLKRDFPERQIIVDWRDQDSDNLTDYQITVFQSRTG